MVVSSVGHYHLVLVGVGLCGGFDEELLQGVGADLAFGGDECDGCVGRQELFEGLCDALSGVGCEAVVFVNYGYELLVGGALQYVVAELGDFVDGCVAVDYPCLLYTSPSPRDS